MLSEQDKNLLLSEFPNIKLSYEKITHKKVYDSDLILSIPCGTKCFSWFTTLNDNCVCILFELENSKNKEFKNIRTINACFSKALCYGTLFYGTLFSHMKNKFFSIEDIFFYKGRDLSQEKWSTKFNKIIDILKTEIKQKSYNNHFVIFGLPNIAFKNENLEASLRSDIKYNIASIQYYNLNKSNQYSILEFDKFNKEEILETREIKERRDIKDKTENKESSIVIQKTIPVSNKYIILDVKPDLQNDIYHLYSSENIKCGIASIPDYKTSIMMNKLFRNIKENDDLDKLEESDDEEEFENPNIDKFVDLNKSIKMKCQYNKKFKKWVPIQPVKDNARLSSNNEIDHFIRNIVNRSNKNY